MWRNVAFDRVRAFIEKFRFQVRLSVFNDTKPLLDWLKKVTDAGKLGTWNVIVAGKNDSKNGVWVLPNGREVNKVMRTRKVPKNEAEASLLNIGVLRGPRDLLCDIDINAVKDPAVKKDIIGFIHSGGTKAAMAYRDKAGLETTPQMLIYRVDKDSKASGGAGNRIDLEAKSDLVGICLYIPGGKAGTSYVSAVSIKMQNDVFDGSADVEGADED